MKIQFDLNVDNLLFFLLCTVLLFLLMFGLYIYTKRLMRFLRQQKTPNLNLLSITLLAYITKGNLEYYIINLLLYDIKQKLPQIKRKIKTNNYQVRKRLL